MTMKDISNTNLTKSRRLATMTPVLKKSQSDKSWLALCQIAAARQVLLVNWPATHPAKNPT